jgi:hypothetical protein
MTRDHGQAKQQQRQSKDPNLRSQSFGGEKEGSDRASREELCRCMAKNECLTEFGDVSNCFEALFVICRDIVMNLM